MLIARNLEYEYPGIVALDHVSFHVPRGSIVAVVGPNGAGKSTLFRCLAGIDAPASGQVLVDGVDTAIDPRACHRRLGFLPDTFGLFDDLTVGQSLRHFASASGLPPKDAFAAAASTAARVGLADKLQERVSSLSRGMRQRLGIGQLLVRSPSILLLDEPASGLDPGARASLSTLIRSLRDDGCTLVVSSHILTELQEYADRMIVMDQGRIVSDVGSPDTSEVPSLLLEIATDSAHEVLLCSWGKSLGLEFQDQKSGQVRFRSTLEREALRTLVLELVRQDSIPIYGFRMESLDMQGEYLRAMQGNPS